METLFFNLSYSLTNLLNLHNLKNSNWLNILFSNIFNYYSKIKAQTAAPEVTTPKINKGATVRPSFIKEMFLFICDCFTKYDTIEFITSVLILKHNLYFIYIYLY